MKIKINFCEKKTSAKGSEYLRASVILDRGNGPEELDNVAIFSSFPGFADIGPGSEIEGNLEEKDYNGSKSYSISGPKPQGGGNMQRVMKEKETMIISAQDRKAQNIASAQERNEQMWAKYSATELIAHHQAFKNLSESEILSKIHILASSIVNDVLEPF